MVRGSFFTAIADDGEAMDAEVWSRLPQDLVWEVLLRLPAAKHFQLQSVNHRWRQVLTCAAFRRGVVAAAALAEQQQGEQEQRGVVVACVSKSSRRGGGGGGNDNAAAGGDDKVEGNSNSKVVEIDVSSLVPSWFFEGGSYSVVAAGEGLVCISNKVTDGNELKEEEERMRRRLWRWWWNGWCFHKYCVLNPVTRTWRVLPQLPCGFEPVAWLPPTRTAVAVQGFMRDINCEWNGGQVRVATYDLTPPADGRRRAWGLAGYQRGSKDGPVVVALCGGETYWYRQDERRVHVGVPPPPPPPARDRLLDLELLQFVRGKSPVALVYARVPRSPGRRPPTAAEIPRLALVEVAALDEPPAASLLGLGLDDGAGPHADGGGGYAQVCLVAHRGAVFFVAGMWVTGPADVVAGVWRLARERLEWEPLARLTVAELQRLSGAECVRRPPSVREWLVTGASGVGELLCCHFGAARATFKMGLNLGTTTWEFVHHEEHPGARAAGVPELRPDVFVEQPARRRANCTKAKQDHARVREIDRLSRRTRASKCLGKKQTCAGGQSRPVV